MTPTFCDPALIVTRREAGALSDWIVFVVASACLVTFMAVTVGVDLALGQIDRAVERGWLPLGLTFVSAFWILASWLPPSRLSRALRVAVLLPGLHAAAIALAWPAWSALARFVDDPLAASVLVTGFPFVRATLALSCVSAGFSLLVARRRSGEWLHGFVIFALAELLVLGLWLPLSCAVWPDGGAWWNEYSPLVRDVPARVIWTILPPTCVALGFTALALRSPRELLANRRFVVVIVVCGVVLAVATRLDPSPRVLVLYANLIPLLFVAMIVAVGALVGFGAVLALRTYRERRALVRRARTDGVIVADGAEPVFGFEITSWLRGPHTLQRPFSVATSAGTIPVRGAHLVAALPAASSQLRVGESIAVLRPGDRVTIAGHGPAGGDPFRTSAAPLADELFVAPAGPLPSIFTHVALAMWRPCVAYLLIVLAVAIPALAALAAT